MPKMQIAVPELRVQTAGDSPDPVYLVYEDTNGDGVELVISAEAFLQFIDDSMNYVGCLRDAIAATAGVKIISNG